VAKLLPRTKVPALSVPTVAGRTWVLSEQKPQRFTLIVFYRGLHCPVCRGYLGELVELLPEFRARGVEVVAVSSDVEERARRTAAEWQLGDLTVGYGLGLDAARTWGLFISTSRGMTSAGIEEPAQFSEPGVFLVRSDGTLYWSIIQTMPFARPHFRERHRFRHWQGLPGPRRGALTHLVRRSQTRLPRSARALGRSGRKLALPAEIAAPGEPVGHVAGQAGQHPPARA
jgi:peroxiredoxin